MKQRIRLTTLVASLVLAGCASSVSNTPVASFAVPELSPATSAQLADISIDRWWTLFGDPALEHLVEEALARNADLELALARVREAQATFEVARAGQKPTLDAHAAAARGHERQTTSSSYTATLEAGYDVDLWGRLSSLTTAARQQLLATEWARASIEWSLTASVAQAYFELGAIDRQIEVSEAVRLSRANTVVLRRREYSVGAGSEFELRRAEGELAAAESSLASLGRSRAALEHTLSILLGRDANQIAVTQIRFAPLDEAKPLTTVLPQGATAELLVRRPDVRQGEAELAAANANIDAARAATLPSLRLSGVLGSDAKSLSDLFSGPAAIWSLGASIAQPIFDGGRLKARVKEEEARAAQSLASYRKVVAGAVADVREAYAGLDLTQQAFQAERERVTSLSRAHELARRGHAAGALSTLDLLDAERNLYQAQLQQVSAYRDQLIGQVAAYKALGGGYLKGSSS